MGVMEAQRRPGVHLETPGVVLSEGRVLTTTARWGGPGFERGDLQARMPCIYIVMVDIYIINIINKYT